MALDPYRRISRRKHLTDKEKRAPTPRAPWIIGAIGLIALLGMVYQLSVSGLWSKTAHLSDWIAQTPP